MRPRTWFLPEASLGHLIWRQWMGQQAENVLGWPPVYPSQTLSWSSASAGAVASSVVKQKLAEVILKKQQAALERTVHPSSPSIPYR